MPREVLVRDLTWLFCLALGVRLIWAVLTPPWMAPDEPAHFTYVAHLIELSEIPHEPPYERKFPIYSREISTSFSLTQFEDLHKQAHAKGRFRAERAYLAVYYDYGKVLGYNAVSKLRRSAAGASATPYPPFYYWLVGLGYRAFYHSPLLARLFAVRATSAFLGAACAIVAYLFSHTLRPHRGLARAVGYSVALLPMHAYLSGTVNNDTAVCLAATLLCLLSAQVYQDDEVSIRAGALLGGASGLMMMMKPTGAALILVALVTLAIAVRRGKRSLASRALPLLGFVAAFAITFGAWLVYRLNSNALSAPGQYSQESDLISGLRQGQYSLGSYLRFQFELGLDQLYRVWVVTFWGKFGWREWPLPSGIYLGALVTYGAAIAGLVVLWRRENKARAGLVLALSFLLAQALFVWFAADYGLSYRKTGKGLGIMGRYLFPAVAPLFFLVWSGVSALFEKHSKALGLVPVLMLLVQVLSLFVFVFRAFGIELG